jgi:hypothetical protein
MSDLDLPQRVLRYASATPADRTAWTAAEVAHYARAWGLEVRRIALTEDDCEDLGDDLAFPASDKESDTHYEWFAATYGALCWELDAMNPNALRERVRGAVMAELDLVAWERYVAAEAFERASMTKTLKTWTSISGLAQE